MTERRRPTAKNIVDGIVQAMIDGREPLDEGLVLVPASYEVYVHPEAYQELLLLWPRTKEQVHLKLDEELQRLNDARTRGVVGGLRRLARALRRLLFADAYVRRPGSLAGTHERAGDAWHVEFGVSAEPNVDVDHLVIVSSFGAQTERPAYRGHPTLNIRRRTTMLPDGRFETELSMERPVPSRSTRRSSSPSQSSSNVLARLVYEDELGQHIYYMRKDQIVIGRDDGSHQVDVPLATLPDVSREHLRIRYDAKKGAFFAKDVSQFGTTVNNVRLGSSLNEEHVDVDLWHPLPRVAEIGLADVLYIQFEAL